MSSINYRITPLSLSGFAGFYKVDEGDAVEAYREYLEVNKESHHYNGVTLEKWFTTAVMEYVDYLVAKRRKEWEAIDTSNDDAQGRAWAK